MIDLADIVSTAAQSGIGSGFSKMGADAAGIGGGGMRGLEQDLAYQKGALTGIDLVKKRLEARKLRDEAMARDATLQKMTAAFPNMDPGMVDLMANTMVGGMGSDFSSTMSGAKTAQQMDLQRRAAEATDPIVRNQVLAAISGRPQDLTEIEGGVAYNPTVAPAEQSLVVTPAQAAAEARRAMVAESQVARNAAAVTATEDRSARQIAAREAKKIADQARMDGMKISAAQERTVAEAMLAGTEFTLRDEKRASFKNVKGGVSDTVPDRNPKRGPAAATTGMSTPIQTDGQIAAPKSRADYDALPSGAKFLAPDGTMRIKP